MKMKKAIMMMAMVLPVMLMAQSRTPVHKSGETERVKFKFEYMEMHVEEVALTKAVESPKKKKRDKSVAVPASSKKAYKITFETGRSPAKEAHKGMDRAKQMNTPLEALGYLGSMGWELTAVSGEVFYLKRAR